MSLVAELQGKMEASTAKLRRWQLDAQPLPLPSLQLSVPPRPAHDPTHPAASPAAVAEPMEMADTFFEPYQKQHCNYCALCTVRFPDDNQSINRHSLSTEHRGRVAALLPVNHSVLLFVSLFCWGWMGKKLAMVYLTPSHNTYTPNSAGSNGGYWYRGATTAAAGSHPGSSAQVQPVA